MQWPSSSVLGKTRYCLTRGPKSRSPCAGPQPEQKVGMISGVKISVKPQPVKATMVWWPLKEQPNRAGEVKCVCFLRISSIFTFCPNVISVVQCGFYQTSELVLEGMYPCLVVKCIFFCLLITLSCKTLTSLSLKESVCLAAEFVFLWLKHDPVCSSVSPSPVFASLWL